MYTYVYIYDGDCLINSVENLFFCFSVLLAQREKKMRKVAEGMHTRPTYVLNSSNFADPIHE